MRAKPSFRKGKRLWFGGICTISAFPLEGSTVRQSLFQGGSLPAPSPLCDIPSGCCSFTGPWTVTRSSLRMLRRVAAFCRPLRAVLLLVSFPRSRPVVGVPGLCWMWHGVPFARQRRPIVGVLRVCWLLPESFDCFCCPPPPPALAGRAGHLPTRRQGPGEGFEEGGTSTRGNNSDGSFGGGDHPENTCCTTFSRALRVLRQAPPGPRAEAPQSDTLPAVPPPTCARQGAKADVRARAPKPPRPPPPAGHAAAPPPRCAHVVTHSQAQPQRTETGPGVALPRGPAPGPHRAHAHTQARRRPPPGSAAAGVWGLSAVRPALRPDARVRHTRSSPAGKAARTTAPLPLRRASVTPRRWGRAMMSGVEITSTTLTSCQTHSVQCHKVFGPSALAAGGAGLLCYQVPASMAFVTDSNRPQPLWQPPPTSEVTSEAPSLLIHPWTGDRPSLCSLCVCWSCIACTAAFARRFAVVVR